MAEAGEDTGVEDGSGGGDAEDVVGARVVLVLAKQIKHFPPNRGLWLVSRSRPHSKE